MQDPVDNSLKALQEITFQVFDLDKEIEDAGGEITESIEKRMDILARAAEARADFVGHWIETREAAEEQLRAKARAIIRLADKVGQRTERVREKVKEHLIQSDRREFVGDLHIFRLSRNPGKLVIEDESRVPLAYKLIQYVPDRERIKTEIKSGVPVDGAHIEEGVSLRMAYNTKGKA